VGGGVPFLYSTRKVLSYPRTWIKFSADWSGPVLCQLPSLEAMYGGTD